MTLTVGDTVAELTRDDLLIEMVKQSGFETVSDRGVTVVLDTALTPELIEEGYVNELISKIQTMRKENGYDVTDRIRVTLGGNDKLAAIMQKNENAIAKVVLAESFTYADRVEGKAWSINDEKAVLLLERV